MHRFSIIFLLFCSAVFASDTLQNIRLVWTENPQNYATIVWESNDKTKSDFVKLWEEGSSPSIFSASEVKAYDNSYANRRKKKEDADKIEDQWFFRHVKLVGLKPSTKYFLTAHSAGKISRKLYFTTAPEDERTFKLLYVGDSRTRVDVAAQISQQLGEIAAKDPEVLAVIHGGDFANAPILSDWRPWLAAWDKTTGKDGKLLPIIPVAGNHEQIRHSKMFGQAYGFPDGDNFCYSCDLSPHFRIAVLNSEIPATGFQEDFLKKTLDKYKSQKVKWQLAAFHRPVFPAIKKPGALKRLIPLFEKYKIDLVLESDGHCIKRTVPIQNGKKDKAGVVYLGEGGFGAPQRTPKELWYLQEPGFASKGDHHMELRVSSKSIDYQTLSEKGKLLDSYSFKPRKR